MCSSLKWFEVSLTKFCSHFLHPACELHVLSSHPSQLKEGMITFVIENIRWVYEKYLLRVNPSLSWS